MTKNRFSNGGYDLQWDDLVLLYLYVHGSSWMSDLYRNVTRSWARLYKVVGRLEDSGLVERVQMIIGPRAPQKGQKVCFLVLTDKGKEYVEKCLLTKLRCSKDQLKDILYDILQKL